MLSPRILMVLGRALLLVWLTFAPGTASAEAEGTRPYPYRVWLEGPDYQVNRSGALGEDLQWVIIRDGKEDLSRLATNELQYTYFSNAPGSEYFVYLKKWGGRYYERVSNIVGYRPGVVSDAPIITSNRAAVALVGQPFRYVITATGDNPRYTTSALPAGLSLDDQGVISGTPTELGQYAVTLGAAVGQNQGTAAFALSVVSGVNEGGSTDLYTLVLDSSYHVTWNSRPAPSDLGMVVRQNGTVVLDRNVLGSTRDSYFSNLSGSTYTIHLASGGERVSNIVAYIPGTANGLPLITSSLFAAGILGQPFTPYQIVAQNSPLSYSATGLPNGLVVSPTTGRITGTPAESGTFYVELAAANAVGAARARLVLTIHAAPSASLPFTLVLDADGVVRRSAGDMHALCWVVRVDGRERLRRSAGAEDAFHYYRAAVEPNYTVQLEAWLDGAYRRVSNIVGSAAAFAFIGDSRLLLLAGQAMAPHTILLGGDYSSLSTGPLPEGITRSGAVLSGTPTTPGVYAVALHASSGNASAQGLLTIEVRSAPPDTGETFCALSLDRESLTVTRGGGDAPALSWVVSKGGEVVLRRSAKGELSFTYHRNFLPGEYTVHLEAAVEGLSRRVSNVVGYVTPAHDGAPVFASPRHLVFEAGRALSFQFLASDSPDSYAALNLPPGLWLGADGLLGGTPTLPGNHAVTLSATRGALTGRAAFTFEVTPARSGSNHANRHRLVLGAEYLVVRSPGEDPNLSWVVKRDGVEQLNRLAGGELQYRYYRNFEPGHYTVHLEAYLDGAYQIVSNVVSYTVADGDQALLAHALGAVNGRSATYLQPSLSIASMPDGRPALALSYTVNRADDKVRATLESSTNLRDWTEVQPLRRISGGDETFELREDLVPVETGPPRFHRVRLERVDTE